MSVCPFSDIHHHWAKASILHLVEQGWLVGSQHQPFRPDGRITRAEFAALLMWVFPQALPVRVGITSPLENRVSFRDVSAANSYVGAIAWTTQRGLLTGYRNGTFQPRQWLTRSQAFVSVVRGLQTSHLPISDLQTSHLQTSNLQTSDLLSSNLLSSNLLSGRATAVEAAAVLAAYFEDAAEVKAAAIAPLAAAAMAGLIVSRLDIRQLRPTEPITRAELAGLLDRLNRLFGRPSAVPPERVTDSILLKDIQDPMLLPLPALKGNPPLVKEIQTRLHRIGLHPGDDALNGQYAPRTEAALMEFCRVLELPKIRTCGIDQTMAQALLNTNEACFALATGRDRPRIFQDFLQQEAGFSASRLAFLDRGLDDSPFRDEVATYPRSFRLVPDGVAIRALGDRVIPRGTKQPVPFRPFPVLGELPQIDNSALQFLHNDIAQACVCVGNWVNGEFTTRWLGRNALSNTELWSATKFVPFLHIAARINARFPDSDLNDCRVRSRGGRGHRFFDLAQDVVSYDTSIGSSNPLAAMFKQFDTAANLENWVKRITGNRSLQFRGRYGSNASFSAPEIWDETLQQVVLRSTGGAHRGKNALSAYDLTRLIAMLGWHLYLPVDRRLPDAQWNSLATLVRVLGHDSARYFDVAIARLGLTNFISSPVVISKMGFGRSGDRRRTELVYTALVQFIDAHQCQPTEQPQPPVLRTMALTLVGVKRGGNEAVHIDARLAAEVTEILRRLVTQEMV